MPPFLLRCLLATFLVLTAACSRPEAGEEGLTLAGSTSVQPFAEKLAEHYMAAHPEAVINVQGGGSSAGVQAVRSGAAQIGMSSRDLSAEERDLLPITIARDAIAIIVHPSNPIDSISLDELRDIFAEKCTSWGALGGREHGIHFITREEGSGTREAFEKKVMRDEHISLGSLVQDSNGAVLEIVANDPDAIGYISCGIVNERIKALAIDGVAPREENFENKRYKLIRPFLFVRKTPPDGLAKKFVDYVLCEEGQSLLKQEGLVTVSRPLIPAQ